MAGPTVTVACKLPNGLRMRLFRMQKTHEPVLGGGSREVQVAHETGAEFTLNGWSHPQNKASRATIEGGYALTPNVPKDFWDAWFAQNKDTDFVKKGLIFAHEKESSTIAEAREKVAVRSGLERLDPNKMPKGVEKSDLIKSSDVIA